MNKDGDPWFVAADVCKAIGLTQTTNASRNLDDDEVALTSIKGLSRGNDKANIVSESGMYTLVLRCRDAVKQGSVPHQFRKWVTGEVLPAICKTGSYHNSMISDLSFNGQILMTFENGTAVSQKTLHPGEKVLTLNAFMELAKKAGYLIIHRENFLNMENCWKY
ncbi:BRO-N domain-containing protein [Photorhabdus temperata]|uniref:BRO-N domain-containing protein n=1 Tax=Photorhabdus temperata TaxID=574560 RepID=UPI003BB6E9E1